MSDEGTVLIQAESEAHEAHARACEASAEAHDRWRASIGRGQPAGGAEENAVADIARAMERTALEKWLTAKDAVDNWRRQCGRCYPDSGERR